jgi:hypothetical protein
MIKYKFKLGNGAEDFFVISITLPLTGPLVNEATLLWRFEVWFVNPKINYGDLCVAASSTCSHFVLLRTTLITLLRTLETPLNSLLNLICAVWLLQRREWSRIANEQPPEPKG